MDRDGQGLAGLGTAWQGWAGLDRAVLGWADLDRAGDGWAWMGGAKVTILCDMVSLNSLSSTIQPSTWGFGFFSGSAYLGVECIFDFFQGDHDGVAVIVDGLHRRQLVVVLEVERLHVVNLRRFVGGDVDRRLPAAMRTVAVPVAGSWTQTVLVRLGYG